MADAPVRYWDSAAFLGYLRQEEDRWQQCLQVLSAGDKGELQILTSAFTSTEVLHLKGQERIPVENALKVRDVFQRSCIVLRNLDRPVAELAQLVVWDDSIRPKDAVHVATALFHGAEVLETFDTALIGKSPITHEGYKPLVVREPHMAAGEMFPDA